eukprot:284396-Pyramimonas_sp.AAC.3
MPPPGSYLHRNRSLLTNPCTTDSQIAELERTLGSHKLSKQFRELQQDRLEQDRGSDFTDPRVLVKPVWQSLNHCSAAQNPHDARHGRRTSKSLRCCCRWVSLPLNFSKLRGWSYSIQASELLTLRRTVARQVDAALAKDQSTMFEAERAFGASRCQTFGTIWT